MYILRAPCSGVAAGSETTVGVRVNVRGLACTPFTARSSHRNSAEITYAVSQLRAHLVRTTEANAVPNGGEKSGGARSKGRLHSLSSLSIDYIPRSLHTFWSARHVGVETTPSMMQLFLGRGPSISDNIECLLLTPSSLLSLSSLSWGVAVAGGSLHNFNGDKMRTYAYLQVRARWSVESHNTRRYQHHQSP